MTVWTHIKTELSRGFDVTGTTGIPAFGAMTLAAAIALGVSMIVPGLILLFPLVLVPYSLSHIRRLNEAGFGKAASNLVVWSVTATFTLMLLMVVATISGGGPFSEFTFTDEDMIWTMLTLGIYAVFKVGIYVIDNVVAIALLLLGGTILLSGPVLTVIGLTKGPPGERRAPPPPARKPIPPGTNPWGTPAAHEPE